MSDEFVVRFLKDKDYSRFNVHGILPSQRMDSVMVHLYEETMPMMTEFRVLPNGDSSYEAEEGNVINYVHATVTIPMDRLPQIIEQLNNIYNQYIEENSGE